MNAYDELQTELKAAPQTWLVTGVAGFIGSNLLEALLKLDQQVVGLDNYATGHKRNLELVKACVSPAQWQRFRMLEGDIRDPAAIARAIDGATHVLHLAAQVSVRASVEDPPNSCSQNVLGFVNVYPFVFSQ